MIDGLGSLIRLGRNLIRLVTLLEELQALGIAFVSLNESLDATTPAGKLQMHILGAIAEFERARIAERVKAGPASQGAREASRTTSQRRRRPSPFLAGPCARQRGSG